jgi:predicted NUDIX family NTP pyrophosphohydrolase
MSHVKESRVKEISAGLLAFRRRNGIEVLLGHPGGPFWAKKDDGVWTIPKGLVDSDEDLIAAARREFSEETNLPVTLLTMSETVALAPVNRKSGKQVHAFAFEADLDLTGFASNLFEIEWPPKSGRRQSFPELDRIAYFTLPTAMTKIIAYQQPFLRELAELCSPG